MTRFADEILLDSEMDLTNIHLQSKRQKKIFFQSCTKEQMRHWQNKIDQMKRDYTEDRERLIENDRHDRVQRSRIFQ